MGIPWPKLKEHSKLPDEDHKLKAEREKTWGIFSIKKNIKNKPTCSVCKNLLLNTGDVAAYSCNVERCDLKWVCMWCKDLHDRLLRETGNAK